MLSQHFWNASQREKYQSAAMEERQLSLLQLHSMVHDVQSNRELAEVLSRAKEQLEVTIIKYSMLLTKPVAYNPMHLDHLCYDKNDLYYWQHL